MTQQPNMLWIFVDQLRWQSLSCHGDVNVQTPNIDRLAAQGASWTHAITNCPVCTPARANLLTGQYADKTGVYVLGDLLAPDKKTIAHAYNDAGYQTSYFGKWHLASTQNAIGHNEGIDYWIHPLLRGGFTDWAAYEVSNHFWTTHYCTDDTIWPPKKVEGYQTDVFTDMSLEYLKEQEANEKPWFHVLSLEAPHHGSDQEGNATQEVGDVTISRHPAPEEYEARFQPEDIVLRDNVPEERVEAARVMLAQYYAMISNLDDNVGRLLDYLDESGQAENTLVCLTSDHGEFGGSHWRFQKASWLEESARIPLIMRLPKIIPEGKTPKAPIGLADVFPTCAKFCEVPVQPDVQGHDFTSVLLEDAPAPREAVPIFWHGNYRYHHGATSTWQAIRTERYTYVEDEEGKCCSCFDNDDDPYQLNDLSHNEEVASLRAQLSEILTKEFA